MKAIAIKFIYLVLIVASCVGCASNSLVSTPTLDSVALDSITPNPSPVSAGATPTSRPNPTAVVAETPTPPPTSTFTPSPSPTPPNPCAISGTAQLESTVIALTAKWDGMDAIYTVRGDGSKLTKLTRNGLAPAWSPDGKKIAFLVKTENRNQLHLINPDGTEETTITLDVSVVPVASSTAMVWSLDSRRIAFIGDTPNTSGIYVLNIDDYTLTNLTPPITYITGAMLPAWSPDGKAIAFHAPLDEVRGSLNRVIVTDVDGTGLHIIDSEAFDDMEPQWHPKDGRILFVSREISQYPQLFTVMPDGSDRRKLTNTETDGKYSPSWSPDGQKIAYIAHNMKLDSQGRWVNADEWLYLLDSDGRNQMTVVQGQSKFVTLRQPEWSSNSRYIAFAWAKSTNLDLYVADTCTLMVNRVVRNVSDYLPSWKP